MFTKNSKALATIGVIPISPLQQVFKSMHLFGVFSPVNENKFLLEMPFCNSQGFQVFLNESSVFEPDEFKIMEPYNGKGKVVKLSDIESQLK